MTKDTNTKKKGKGKKHGAPTCEVQMNDCYTNHEMKTKLQNILKNSSQTQKDQTVTGKYL